MHKRLWGSINRRNSGTSSLSPPDLRLRHGTGDISEKAIPDGDSPEATVARGVRLFCESGGPNNTGDEVLHLPTVVEAAESSPAAAGQAALAIRKFLSSKNHQRAYVQYNSIMLVRILADNPGKTFTRNIDARFVTAVKELLREGRDMSVQQILRETLESFETQKPDDETLAGLREMWKKEKAKQEKRSGMQPGARVNNPQTYQQQVQQQQNYFARSHHHHNPNAPPHHQRAPKSLPPPSELAQRSKRPLPPEVLRNELIKEFVERCQSASRSMQTYIHSDAPAPDEDTLLTLIETNDQLATAMSRHQRALLQARRLTSAGGVAGQGGWNSGGGLFATSAANGPAAGQPAGGGGSGQMNGVGGLPMTAGGGGAFMSPPSNQRFLQHSSSGADQANPFGDHNEARDQGGPSMHAPTAPPMQMEYGLPPAGVAVPEAGGMDGTPSRGLDELQQQQQQPRKPRYRF
ncbi:MAG: hypothetical protein OHK93_007191 [Ramalina farinacea]|uniref:GAT domain-containing protein n=1 Tax=Ramalina farinacea TaxID=258253 RepID=A0AA43QK04_9LECA|nr:hypothetical protein [Ramalina farinacea]